MADLNETCCFCGGEIIFRNLRGIASPIHRGKIDCIGRKLHRRDQEGVPFWTDCPRCHGRVVFLRHNGGSVWLDELGAPWPRHGCFVKENSAAWDKVWPAAAMAMELPKYLFALSLGPLKTRDGIVLYLRHSRTDLRRDPKYAPQAHWVIDCAPEDFEELGMLFDNSPVVADYEAGRLVTLKGREFTIRKHTPRYSS